MPHKNARGIDVSAEEERYLRGAFRRFALPYVLIFAALVWIASALGGSDAGGASPESVTALEEGIEELRSEVAALKGHLDEMGAEVEKTGGRVAALEKRPKAPASTGDPTLARKVRDAASRVEQLEKKVADQAAPERIDALAARMTRIEHELRAAAVPPQPAAVAPMPPPSAAPAP